MAIPTEGGATGFGFTDLNGFKDFVVFVLSCAPELFPEEDWLPPDQQMDLEKAFTGLRCGLDILRNDAGETPLLAECGELIEKAYAEYRAGRDADGQANLEEVAELLAKPPPSDREPYHV